MKNQKGFTLIEVVLVLAIGGLIFLLAFLAFQQVSTNRRDTQRRSDAGRIVADMQNYLADKRSIPVAGASHPEDGTGEGICAPGVLLGSLFPDFNVFSSVYVCKDGKFLAPTGKNYTTTTNGGTLTVDQVRYTNVMPLAQTLVPITLCDNTSTTSVSAYKIEIGLEKGVACRDSK